MRSKILFLFLTIVFINATAQNCIVIKQGGGVSGGAVNCTDIINCVPKYVDSVYRKIGIDSIYWYKNGVEYAIKELYIEVQNLKNKK